MSKLFIFVLLTSCALQKNSLDSLSSQSLVFEINKINRINNFHFLKYQFDDYKVAYNFALNKRLLLQRMYETTSEPYFGKPEEKLCSSNIDLSGKIHKFNDFFSSFKLKMLSNENYVLGDCLLENNSFIAHYSFFICKENVFEIRQYIDYGKEITKIDFKCL